MVTVGLIDHLMYDSFWHVKKTKRATFWQRFGWSIFYHASNPSELVVCLEEFGLSYHWGSILYE